MKRTNNKTGQFRIEQLQELLAIKVVKSIELGRLTIQQAKKKYNISEECIILNWIRKYGTFDTDYIVIDQMQQTKDPNEVKRLKELIKARDEEISRLKKEIYMNKQKGIMAEALLEIIKEDYNIDLSKKVMSGQLTDTSSKEEKEG